MRIPILVLAVGLTAACAARGAPATAPSSPRSTASAASATAPASTAGPSNASSPLLRFELTDVRSASRFTLGEFAGKTVLVLGMAVW